MALTKDEKTLLQYAIGDGVFNAGAITSLGVPDGNGSIVPSVLQYVATLADEDIRVVLRAYQAQVVPQLADTAAKQQAQFQSANRRLNKISTAVVTPEPSV